MIKESYVLRDRLLFQLGEFPFDMEVNNGEVLTVPDMAVPLRDLLDRYMKGREIPTMGDAVYEGHLEGIPDLRRMDKVDRELYAQSVRRGISELQTRLQDEKKKKKVEEVESLHARIKELEAQANIVDNMPEDKT